jgi:hypothetical protein
MPVQAPLVKVVLYMNHAVYSHVDPQEARILLAKTQNCILARGPEVEL